MHSTYFHVLQSYFFEVTFMLRKPLIFLVCAENISKWWNEMGKTSWAYSMKINALYIFPCTRELFLLRLECWAINLRKMERNWQDFLDIQYEHKCTLHTATFFRAISISGFHASQTIDFFGIRWKHLRKMERNVKDFLDIQYGNKCTLDISIYLLGLFFWSVLYASQTIDFFSIRWKHLRKT